MTNPIHPWPKARFFILSTWLFAAEETVRDVVSGYLRARAAILGDPAGPPPVPVSRSAWKELCRRIELDRLRAVKTVRKVLQIAEAVDDWPQAKRLRAMLRAVLAALHEVAPPDRRLLAEQRLPVERQMPRLADRLLDLAREVRDYRIRLSREVADLRARELILADADFVNKTAAQWASAIGCSDGLAASLPAWTEAMEITGRGRTQGRPSGKTLPLSDKVLRSMKLKALVEQQRRQDHDPEPLGPRRRKAVNSKPA